MPVELENIPWTKMSQGSGTTTKKMILDALEAESSREASLGRPSSPVLPLVGSMNVPITTQEEVQCE